MPTTTRRPRGRPLRLDDPVATTTDGRTITVAERCIAATRMGEYREDVAALAGITKSTLNRWLQIGARTQTAIENGTPAHTFTANDRRLADFSVALYRAEAESRAQDVGTLQRLAEGGLERTVTTTRTFPCQACHGLKKVGDPAVECAACAGTGRQTEITERTETMLPDGATLRWRMEHRFPERWGRSHLSIDLGTGDDDDVRQLFDAEESRALFDSIGAAVREVEAYAAGVADGHEAAAQP